MQYCVPHRRELTGEERDLLRFLLTGNSTLASQIDRLKVVARCGCGKCPTILFGESLDAAPLTSSGDIVADYYGPARNGTTVGVTVTERDGKLAELEASVVFDGEIEDWPPIDALVPVRQAGRKLEGKVLQTLDHGRANTISISSNKRPWWRFW